MKLMLGLMTVVNLFGVVIGAIGYPKLTPVLASATYLALTAWWIGDSLRYYRALRTQSPQ